MRQKDAKKADSVCNCEPYDYERGDAKRAGGKNAVIEKQYGELAADVPQNPYDTGNEHQLNGKEINVSSQYKRLNTFQRSILPWRR